MLNQHANTLLVWLFLLGLATANSTAIADIVPVDPTSERWREKYEPYLATLIEVDDIATIAVMYKGKREVVRLKNVATRAELEARRDQEIETKQVTSADIDRALRCRSLIVNHLRSIIKPNDKVLLGLSDPARDGSGQLLVDEARVLAPVPGEDGRPGYIFYGLSDWFLIGDGFALPNPARWNDQSNANAPFAPGRLDLYERCKKDKYGIFSTWVDELLKESDVADKDDRQLKCTVPLANSEAWRIENQSGDIPEVLAAKARVVLEATTPDDVGILCQHADDINQELRRLLNEADDNSLRSKEVASTLAAKLKSYARLKLAGGTETNALKDLRIVDYEISMRK
ncbi:hypothetical protein [Aeoliella sp. SH292]|uniref:hypothetical protein n=1 Tax=Aeoliella sp. SH292 TaxID=3454464 RepID=UPI003F9D7AC4